MLALDTNVLVYAEGIGDEQRREASRLLIKAGQSLGLAVPAQVLAELYRVLVRKGRVSPGEARTRVARYGSTARVLPTLSRTLTSAVDLAADHPLQIFDAIILVAAGEAKCDLLLSEDMQDGFVWRGVTVANPFAPTLHPLLADALRH